MSVYQHWLAQRERLRESLHDAGDTSTAYVFRHAIAQIEQNTMAEQSDDLLRQQTGVLFSCVKQSLNLLDVPLTTKIWLAHTQAVKPSRERWSLLYALSILLQALVGLYGYSNGHALIWVPLAISMAATLFGLIVQRRSKKQSATQQDDMRVTAKPDSPMLLLAIEAQMKAIDRFINDFIYLNEQRDIGQNSPELRYASLLAEMIQVLYTCEGEAREEAVAAGERLLTAMGISAVPYTPESAYHFTILPSLDETRTLMPALISQKDGQLLARGTAAVIMQHSQTARLSENGAEASPSPQEDDK